jgi:hypothetical protein
MKNRTGPLLGSTPNLRKGTHMNFPRPKTIAALLVLVLTSVAVLGQKGTSIVSRISFARGRTTAVLTGTVRRGTSHDYLLKARARQTMSVHLSARGEVSFVVRTPGGDTLADFSKDWSGELPESGDYRINVLPDTSTERIISYTLEVTVRN